MNLQDVCKFNWFIQGVVTMSLCTLHTVAILRYALKYEKSPTRLLNSSICMFLVESYFSPVSLNPLSDP